MCGDHLYLVKGRRSANTGMRPENLQQDALVLEEIDLLGLAANVEVMRELALEALGTLPRLEVLAHYRLGIDACTTQTQS